MIAWLTYMSARTIQAVVRSHYHPDLGQILQYASPTSPAVSSSQLNWAWMGGIWGWEPEIGSQGGLAYTAKSAPNLGLNETITT